MWSEQAYSSKILYTLIVNSILFIRDWKAKEICLWMHLVGKLGTLCTQRYCENFVIVTLPGVLLYCSILFIYCTTTLFCYCPNWQLTRATSGVT